MSVLRRSTEAQRLALKAAFRRALTRAGGCDSVEHVTRVKAPALCRYASPKPEHDVVVPPIDVCLDLDLDTGDDALLRAWADLRNCDVVPRGVALHTGKPWMAKFGEMARQEGELIATISDALADDGAIDAGEADEIVAVARARILGLQRLISRVEAEAEASATVVTLAGARS